jgi:hypothetical protein
VLTATFSGRTAVPAPGAGPGQNIWSYRIESGGPGSGGDLPVGQRIALGLPRDVQVRAAESYPGVPALEGVFVQRDPASSRQYVGRQISSPGPLTISFVAPAGETTYEVLLARGPSSQNLAAVPFLGGPGSIPQSVQVLPGPVAGPAVFTGRPPVDFTGTVPHASELFGVYQPLAGWFGRLTSLHVAGAARDDRLARLDGAAFAGEAARALDTEALTALAARAAAVRGVLSPVGLVNLFREYFFEFDTFLGGPVGHLWISPGGTVELVETSTRRMLVERTAEQSEETSRRVEESLTEQDDLTDAVKEDNANDTTLGVSATGGVNAGIYHADATASFGLRSTVRKSSEHTHKHTRAQSIKIASEIKRNYKTTFKTVTETTDTSSRRYVVQNTGDELVNYELRRKMRKVGVQVQHVGTRLSWQVYLDAPGRDLGLGHLVHVVPEPDVSSIRKPEPPPPLVPLETTYVGPFPLRKYPQTANDPHINMNFGIHAPGSDRILDYGNEFHLVATADFGVSAPSPGYTLAGAVLVSAKSGGADRAFVPELPVKPNDAGTGFTVIADFLNTGDLSPILLTFALTWNPPKTDAAHEQHRLDLIEYEARVAELQRAAYAEAVRDRLKLISAMRSRPSRDLRSEERQSVYGGLVDRLRLFDDPHLDSELVRQIFDVDEMLYFVAPDHWRPSTVVTHPTEGSVGKYPVPPPPSGEPDPPVLHGQTVGSWYSHTTSTNALDPEGHATPEWRVNYLITEDTGPAPLGSSLGWLIQADGDERRNEFLNAAWAKAVLPVRPGRELDALRWLTDANVEGEAALGVPYQFVEGDPEEYRNKNVGEVLSLLSAQLSASNTDIANTVVTEEVFETGFDPLDGGFRPAEPYEVFDQWFEVLPTDQVVAVPVRYDPATGQQL